MRNPGDTPVVPLRRIHIETDALVLVDPQRDLARECVSAERVVHTLNRWLEVPHLTRIATRHWHPTGHCSFRSRGGDMPIHCIQGTDGAEFIKELNSDAFDLIVSKGSDIYAEGVSAFDAVEMGLILHLMEITRLWIGGFMADRFVRATALEALRRGFCVELISDGLAFRSDADEPAVRRELRDAGCGFVETDEILGVEPGAPTDLGDHHGNAPAETG